MWFSPRIIGERNLFYYPCSHGYVVELTTFDEACPCVGLSQVVPDGDCPPATYDPIKRRQPAVMTLSLQGIPS